MVDDLNKWMMVGLMAIGYIHILVKSSMWFLSILLRSSWRLFKRKDKRALALDTLYDAFEVGEIKPGECILVKTESGRHIKIWQTLKENADHE